MTRDHRDVVIEQLAVDEAALLDYVVELTRERDAYRQLAHEGIHALHDAGECHDRLRAQHRALLEEFRRTRQQMKTRAA